MAVRTRELHSARRSTAPSIPLPKMASGQGLHKIVSGITLLLAILALYAVIAHVLSWGRVQYDDLRYGATRTTHADAIVGHNDGSGTPSHFVAMNLNRQVLILEIPGGNTSDIRTFTGPYLFGAGEDKTPISLDFRDINKDGSRDMIVTIKQETLVYVNRDGSFQPISLEERAKLEPMTDSR